MAAKAKDGEHIVLLDGGAFRCLHCGATHNPYAGKRSLELWELSALANGFAEQHHECPPPSGPRCTFCSSPSHPWTEHVNATTKTPQEWLTCGDTGISSRTIWRRLTGLPLHMEWTSHPHDPADFGRCYRLLHAPWAAGWPERIGEMAAESPEWAALVAVWPELEALYLEEIAGGEAPKLYARMHEIVDAVANGTSVTVRAPRRRKK